MRMFLLSTLFIFQGFRNDFYVFALCLSPHKYLSICIAYKKELGQNIFFSCQKYKFLES